MTHNTTLENGSNIQPELYLHNAPHNWQVELTNARTKMSEANRAQFDIEAADHLQYLIGHPEEEMSLQRSILHRIQLYQARNMTCVPPMLFPRVGESAQDHEDRELAAGGYVRVDTLFADADPFVESTTDLKCLTVLEPFAWLIVNGGKDIENRSWQTKFRGTLGIHSGQRLFDTEKWIVDWYGEDVLEKSKAQRGHIVGLVDVVDCVDAHSSEWFSGPYGWVLANPRPIKPIPYKGAQGLWNAKVNIQVIATEKQQELF